MMKILQLALCLSCFLLTACSTSVYHPQDVSIFDRHLEDFTVSGRIHIESITLKEAPVTIYKGLSPVKASLSDIADSLARQTKREILENSTIDGELDKPLFIQVSYLYFSDTTSGLSVNMRFSVVGERGFETFFTLNQPLESNVFNKQAAFDQAIVLAVTKVLTNADTLKYLACNQLHC